MAISINQIVQLNIMNVNVDLFYFINNGLSNPYFDFIMPHITDIGGLAFYAVVLAILLLLSWKDIFGLGKYFTLVKLCVASLILTVVITAGAKLFFSQPRPYLVLEHVNVLTATMDPNSFPSGHTATTLSTMTVLFLSAKRYFTRYNLVKCFCVVFSILIAFSRIYIGMHYPFDVLVGGVIGLACGVLTCKYLKSIISE